jgi:hypothetical protein
MLVTLCTEPLKAFDVQYMQNIYKTTVIIAIKANTFV